MTGTTTQERLGLRTFYIVWFGQLISLIGTSLTGFGLSIFVFLETGSVTQLAAISMASLLPRLILGPFAGAVVDRWDRRKAMLLSDLGSGVGTLVLVALYFTDNLALWNILIAVGISGIFQAFQWPAYNAAMQVLVPQDQLGRAAGLVQLAEGIGSIGGPIIAGFLVATSGIGGVFVVDVLTFLFAVGTLLVVRFPKPVVSEAGAEGAGSIWEETKYGFIYVWKRHGLFALMIYFAIINLAFGFIGPLFIPLGLSVTGPAELGTAFAVGSTGMLAGGIVASTWGGPKHRIAGIMATGGLLGLCMVAVGFRASIIWITAIIWIAMSMIPIMSASSQALWLSKVEPDLQGRVSSVRMTVAQAAIPIAYLLVGPLADYVFEPVMAEDGLLSGALGPVMGSGDGRGYALFFMAIGVVVIVMSFIAWSYPPLRHVEAEIPDVEVAVEGAPEIAIALDVSDGIGGVIPSPDAVPGTKS